MKTLLIYPRYPDTFWSFKHALKFVSKKAAFPPMGLLTVASMLPGEWKQRLVDLNVGPLTDADLRWADIVFISAMAVQKKSAREVVDRAKRAGVKVVAGGPLFTAGYEGFEDVDHLVLGEAELTLPPFLRDLEAGSARRVYSAEGWADLATTPCARWDLIDPRKYSAMSVQYSRGCPFSCEFCDIIVLYGQTPRTKSSDQLLAELDVLNARGWRGAVFFADDNLIGNKKKLKEEILPALIGWTERHRHPFFFATETSLNLADDEELIRLMVRADFRRVFIGIETPHDASLVECNKKVNRSRDMLAAVRKIQRFGLEVQGGFIVGFDNDPPSIFEKQIAFIQKSGIVTAMVGLLNAPRGTKLYSRLKDGQRIREDSSGDNTDFSINFIPKMNREALLRGYEKIVRTIYSPKCYYDRIIVFLKTYRPSLRGTKLYVSRSDIEALLKSVWLLGIRGKERLQYWKLLLWTLARRPQFFGFAVTFAIYGFHFRKVAETIRS